ncbi:DUF2162 family putative transporter [Methanothrix sp.]|uniref:DUF2162 family putative transporter n=1 Tax=Methanothrix sp. TaxID=90426 RepID=UPI003BB692E6
MEKFSNFVIFGIAAALLIMAFKAGLGCGFASLKKREVIYFASIYLIVSGVVSLLIGFINIDLTLNLLMIGAAIQIIIAAGMIYFGIKTKREWQSRRHDISKKTFLWLIVPCPICVTAIFLASTALAGLIDRSNIVAGGIIGVAFLAGMCLSSYFISLLAMKRNCKDPSALGTILLLFGMLYLLLPLMIPAFFQDQTVAVQSRAMDLNEMIISSSLMASLTILGIAGDRYGRSKY